MPSSPPSDAVRAANARYWRRNVTLTLVLLVGWFLIGLGCGVLFVEPLNEIKLGGFKLGFWFAQQGAIVGFVLLILIYAIGMGRLDRSHKEELRRLGDSDSEARQ